MKNTHIQTQTWVISYLCNAASVKTPFAAVYEEEVCGAIYLCIIRRSDTWVATARGLLFHLEKTNRAPPVNNAADECATYVLRRTLLFRVCRRSYRLHLAQTKMLSLLRRTEGSSRGAAVIPSTLDANSLVGSSYGLRARSAAVDQSCSPSNYTNPVAMEDLRGTRARTEGWLIRLRWLGVALFITSTLT